MKHRIHGNKLNRNPQQRRALYKGLATQLILRESLTTTLAKAKSIKPLVEKLTTRAKTKTLASRRQLASFLSDPSAVKKLINDLAPRYFNRPGGYLRLTRLGYRQGDRAPQAKIEFIPSTSFPLGTKTTTPQPTQPTDKNKKKPKKTAKAKASTTPKN